MAIVDRIRTSGRFGLSLLAEDQLPLALRVWRGAASPAALDRDRLVRDGDDPPVLERGVGHFVCEVAGEFNADADCVGFHGPVVRFGWGRRAAAQLRADQLTAAERG